MDNEKLSMEESNRIEAIFFEDDEVIKLRDGKEYKIPPSGLKDARRLMQLLKTLNIDAVLLNFTPDLEGDSQKEDNLFEVLEIAFRGYPHLTREYLAEYVDIVTATKIIECVIGLNGLKKSKPQPVQAE
jgi:hypothetical protein